MLLRCSDGVRHQQCEGSWDANHGLVNTSLVLFKRILVGGNGFKSKSAISREGFGQWLADIIPLE